MEQESPQLVENPSAASNPDDGAQPAPAAAYPHNIDVEALTRNMARLIEEGGRAVPHAEIFLRNGTFDAQLVKIGGVGGVAGRTNPEGLCTSYGVTSAM
jgi:hypothetical protein